MMDNLNTYRCGVCGNEITTGPFAQAEGSKGPIEVYVPYTCAKCQYQMAKVLTDKDTQSPAPDLPELPD